MRPLDIVFTGLLILVLIPIVATDLRERRIPNWLNLALGLLGLAHVALRSPTLPAVAGALATAIACGALLLGTVWLLSRLDPRAVFGLGDIKFLVAASFWVGLQGSVAVLIVACLASIVAALAAAPWRGLRLRERQAFAPMLAIGLLVVSVASFATGGASIW